jgi:hypothetical protein
VTFAYTWRVDRVARAEGGAVVRVDEGAPTLDYEKACGEFDAAFLAAGPGQSVRMLRAAYHSKPFELAWVSMREGWQGRETER